MARTYVVEASAVTKAPLAIASRAITDPANLPKWFKGACEVVADGYPAIRGELRWKVAWAGRKSAFHAKVFDNDLPSRLRLHVKTPSGQSSITHSFVRDGEGTRYTKRIEFQGSWVHRLILRTFLPRSVRSEVKAAARLADGLA